MPSSSTAIVVSDAHLGSSRSDDVETFVRFLQHVPDVADHLIINGDLFEFWFEYRHVILRSAFRTLAALHALRGQGVQLTVTGGNHDRWGKTFWREEIGAAFFPRETEVEVGGLTTLVSHGDGIAEPRVRDRLTHAVVQHPLTSAVFRQLHPDWGVRLVRRLTGGLTSGRSEELVTRTADAQAIYAHALLRDRPNVDVLVLGHTHRPALERLDDGRWYVNPGAWAQGSRYSVLTGSGPELREFS